MCTPTNCTRPFGPDGCQVPIGNGVCGEKRTLEFIDEFKRLYERKMEEIDANGGGDCTQEKLRLQQEWIENLIEQNEMLVRAVGELEVEATERVHMLEDKLQKSAQCICEEERKVKKHESTIEELRKRIDYFDSFGNIEGMAKDLKCKTDECESLRQSMVDMRQALTEEVASKHDTILQLKREAQQLEEKCIQADKQTAFRDDIVKELRKEIKQLKNQVFLPEKPFKPEPLPKERTSKGETCIFINHSKKVVQSGKSTIIYLTHNDEHFKSSSKIYQVHANVCTKCQQRLETSHDNENKKNAESKRVVAEVKKVTELLPFTEPKKITGLREVADQNFSFVVSGKSKFLPFCKSESDLRDNVSYSKPVKKRSKFTTSNFKRFNTFVGSTSECLNTVDFESKLKKRNISIPNHIPVKTFVNNIECNRNKSV